MFSPHLQFCKLVLLYFVVPVCFTMRCGTSLLHCMVWCQCALLGGASLLYFLVLCQSASLCGVAPVCLTVWCQSASVYGVVPVCFTMWVCASVLRGASDTELLGGWGRGRALFTLLRPRYNGILELFARQDLNNCSTSKQLYKLNGVVPLVKDPPGRVFLFSHCLSWTR